MTITISGSNQIIRLAMKGQNFRIWIEAFSLVRENIIMKNIEAEANNLVMRSLCLLSYLSNRFQSVSIENRMSSPVHLECGDPQGTVLGPDLFSDYSSPVASFIHSHGISVHCYANNKR